MRLLVGASVIVAFIFYPSCLEPGLSFWAWQEPPPWKMIETPQIIIWMDKPDASSFRLEVKKGGKDAESRNHVGKTT